MKNIFTIILLLSSLSCTKKEFAPMPGSQYPQLTADGAWCWFSDPRAIYHHGTNGAQVVSGWVKKDGTIEAGALNLKSLDVNVATLWDKLEKDDHDNPAFVENAKGQIIAQYTKHGSGMYYMNATNADGDVNSFSKAVSVDVIDTAQLKKFPRKTVTYANPFRLSEENDRLYAFGRWTGFKPNMMWSDDDGATWSSSRVIMSDVPFTPGNRPYVKYHSDGKSRVHLIFTDGHPRNEPTNSVYYAYYENDAFHRIDGTVIRSVDNLPFEPNEASVVYRATEELGKAWIFDLTVNEQGSPVILYTRYPNDQDHRYHYTVYKDGQWFDNEICASGSWFPKTQPGKEEREPNYSAGLTVHPANPDIIYLSRSVNGVFEIEKRITNNYGKTWEVYPITKNSKYDNVRPFVPRNYEEGDPNVVLWMQNELYIHYTKYTSNIRYFVEEM